MHMLLAFASLVPLCNGMHLKKMHHEIWERKRKHLLLLRIGENGHKVRERWQFCLLKSFFRVLRGIFVLWTFLPGLLPCTKQPRRWQVQVVWYLMVNRYQCKFTSKYVHQLWAVCYWMVEFSRIPARKGISLFLFLKNMKIVLHILKFTIKHQTSIKRPSAA